MVAAKQVGHEHTSILRKIRKPLVEKQRRERMNNSIDRLKLLIADTIKKQVAPMTRVDKADILDLTVFHITTLQQQQQQQQRSTAMATEAAAYNAGFKDCARNVMTYLTTHKVTDSCTIKGLIDQLHIEHMPSVSSTAGRPMSTPKRVNDVRHVTSYSNYTPKLSPITTHHYVPQVGLPTQSNDSFLRWIDTSNWFLTIESTADSCYSSMNLSVSTESDVISESDGDVSIVQDVQIGHMVIKDSLWRPF